jgi:hypothetical protein
MRVCSVAVPSALGSLPLYRYRTKSLSVELNSFSFHANNPLTFCITLHAHLGSSNEKTDTHRYSQIHLYLLVS